MAVLVAWGSNAEGKRHTCTGHAGWVAAHWATRASAAARVDPASHTTAFGGQVAAEQQQTHTALRQRRQQLLGGEDVAPYGSGAVDMEQGFCANGVAVDQPLDAVEVWQGSTRVLAPPLQLRADPLLLAPRQELGLQLCEAIERIAQHNPPGFAAEQGVEQRPGSEGGGAGDGDGGTHAGVDGKAPQ